MANINRSTALQASELLGQIVEVIIDNQTLSDGLMKDLPVLGTILGISNIYNNFKAKSFEKKFKNFLLEFDDTEELQRFKDFIDKKEDEELGEVILNVIDKIDKNIQAKMLARAVKLYIYDQSQEENAKKIFDYNRPLAKVSQLARIVETDSQRMAMLCPIPPSYLARAMLTSNATPA